MLFDEDARRQRLGGVTGSTTDRRLHDDRARVELGRDEVDGHAGDVHAVLERLPLRVHARERRQQRRDECSGSAFGNASQNAGAQPPHESGEADQIDAALANRLDQRVDRKPRATGSRDAASRVSQCPPSRARASPGRVCAIRDARPRSRPPSRPAAIASRIAARLLPRPEISTASLDVFTGWGTGLFSTVSACSGTGLQNGAHSAFPLLSRLRLERRMPRRPRSAAPATFFHVINRSVRKAPLFRARHTTIASFSGLLSEGLKRHPVRLLAFCIMSNHWHLVVGPGAPAAALQAPPLGNNYPCGATAPAPQDGRPRPRVSGALQVARDRRAPTSSSASAATSSETRFARDWSAGPRTGPGAASPNG